MDEAINLISLQHHSGPASLNETVPSSLLTWCSGALRFSDKMRNPQGQFATLTPLFKLYWEWCQHQLLDLGIPLNWSLYQVSHICIHLTLCVLVHLLTLLQHLLQFFLSYTFLAHSSSQGHVKHEYSYAPIYILMCFLFLCWIVLQEYNIILLKDYLHHRSDMAVLLHYNIKPKSSVKAIMNKYQIDKTRISYQACDQKNGYL